MSRVLRRAIGFSLSIALVALAAGCGSGGSKHHPGANATGDSTPTEPMRSTAVSDKPGNWTVFVYMNADNNLEGAALADLAQMTKARGTRFVVLVDRSPDYSADDAIGLGNFDDAKILGIQDGNVSVLGEPGEVDMGDPKTLESFLSAALKRYRSPHNALVIWDHGGSWKGAAWDESSNDDNLTVPELTSALKDGLAAGGVKQLDMLGFDACLMASYEVGVAAAPYANYMLASEEVEPGGGWDWSQVSTQGGSTTQQLAKRIMQGFTAESQQGGANDTTLSLVDLTRIQGITQAADRLSSAMRTSQVAKVTGRIGSGRTSSVSYGKDPDPANDYFMVDLGDLARQLGDVPGLQDAASSLGSAVKTAVVAHSDGPVAAGSSGVAAYFPPTRKLVDAKYAQVPTAGSWSRFVKSYYSAAESVKDSDLPSYTQKDRLLTDANVKQGTDGIALDATVKRGTGGYIADATLFWGNVDIKDPTQVVFFGERNAVVDGDHVKGNYDWRYLQISDGASKTVAYSTLTVDRNGNTTKIVVPATYTRGSDSAPAFLNLAVSGGKVMSETFYVRTGDGIAPITPEEGDTFVPLLKHQDLAKNTSEWLPATAAPLAAVPGQLQYSYTTLPGATAVMLGLGFHDVVGNTDFVYYGAATPAELG